MNPQRPMKKKWKDRKKYLVVGCKPWNRRLFEEKLKLRASGITWIPLGNLRLGS